MGCGASAMPITRLTPTTPGNTQNWPIRISQAVLRGPEHSNSVPAGEIGEENRSQDALGRPQPLEANRQTFGSLHSPGT